MHCLEPDQGPIKIRPTWNHRFPHPFSASEFLSQRSHLCLAPLFQQRLKNPIDYPIVTPDYRSYKGHITSVGLLNDAGPMLNCAEPSKSPASKGYLRPCRVSGRLIPVFSRTNRILRDSWFFRQSEHHTVPVDPALFVPPIESHPWERSPRLSTQRTRSHCPISLIPAAWPRGLGSHQQHLYRLIQVMQVKVLKGQVLGGVVLWGEADLRFWVSVQRSCKSEESPAKLAGVIRGVSSVRNSSSQTVFAIYIYIYI